MLFFFVFLWPPVSLAAQPYCNHSKARVFQMMTFIFRQLFNSCLKINDIIVFAHSISILPSKTVSFWAPVLLRPSCSRQVDSLISCILQKIQPTNPKDNTSYPCTTVWACQRMMDFQPPFPYHFSAIVHVFRFRPTNPKRRERSLLVYPFQTINNWEW